MTKHYILNLDPNAKYEWDRCTLRDPITADHPALANLVAHAVGSESGAYLVAVNIEVTVLEKADLQPAERSLTSTADPSTALPLPQLAELVA